MRAGSPMGGRDGLHDTSRWEPGFIHANNFRVTKRQMNLILTYFWLIGVSLIFANTPGNPFGVAGLNEFYLILAFAYTGYSLIGNRFAKGEMLFFWLPIFAMLTSAAIADYVYGQPLYLGLVEERRILALYFYFPLRDLAKNIGYDAMRKAILNTALSCATLGFLWYLGFVPGFRELGKQFALADRANFGSVFVCIAIVLNFRQERIYKSLYLFLFLIFVAQTRQVLIALIIAMTAMYIVDSLRSGKPLLFSALLILIVLALIPVAIDPYMVIAYLPDSFQELTRAKYLERSARALAYSGVFTHFRPLGHGALSNLYGGGFGRYFGESFFLADIGIVGTIHRFGWLAFVFCGLTLTLFVTIWRRAARGEAWQFVAVIAASLTLLVTWPTAGIIEYRGGYLAMLAGLAMVCGQRRRVYVRRAPAPSAGVPQPQLLTR